MHREVIHKDGWLGYVIDVTATTYRVTWYNHLTESGRDWSHVNHVSVDFLP